MRPQLATIGWFHKPATGKEACSSFTPLVLAQVRGLTTTSFKSDEPKFEAMALASLDLCRTYVALYRQASGPDSPAAAAAVSTGGARDLAAARMHLRGVIKQCETSFSGHKLLQDMKALLEEIVGMEEALLAARANAA